MGSSILDPAGTDAAEIATLFWWMTGAGLFIWCAVVGIALFCAHGRRLHDPHRAVPFLIVGGGVVLPALLLAVLLAFGLAPLARAKPANDPARLVIAVAGEQWWWRVRYTTPAGVHIDLANEIRLPVGRRVDVSLSSDNVIHAFWIPALAGKVDMIPGRTTHLSLEPTRTGLFRGACAEYCGLSHALMSFPTEVMTASAFDAWLTAQAEPARPPLSDEALRGLEIFTRHGCGACHMVRGTAATGLIGPDLTHLGSRRSVATAELPNEPAPLMAWIAAPQHIKPGALMPGFAMLPDADARALAAYLHGLQ